MSKARSITKLVQDHRYSLQILKLALIVYVLAWPIGIFFSSLITEEHARAGSTPVPTASEIRVVIQCIVLGLMTLIMVLLRIANNPLLSTKYRDFLAHSAWEYGEPLPFGSCNHTWFDYVLILGLTQLGAWSAVLGCPNHPIMLTLKLILGDGPLFGLALGLVAGVLLLTLINIVVYFFHCRYDRHELPLIILLVPLLIHPHYNVYVGCVVLVMIYLLCLGAMRYKLRTFQWQAPYYETDPMRLLRENANDTCRYTGTLHYLSPYRDDKTITLRAKFLMVLLVCWLCHMTAQITMNLCNMIILHYAREAMEHPEMSGYHLPRIFMNDGLIVVVAGMVGLFAMIYWGRWFLEGPIPVYARFPAGYWFIPKFDVILIKPALLIFWAAVITAMLTHQWISPVLWLYSFASGVVLIDHYLLPNSQQWRYTWNNSGFMALTKPNEMDVKRRMNAKKPVRFFGT